MTIRIAGVDEAGRGPFAGPVCVAAVILPSEYVLEGLNDSKKLSEKKREALYECIIQTALNYSIVFASAAEIDEKNILRATEEAMSEAVLQLKHLPDLVLVDGHRLPVLPCDGRAVVGGDAIEPSIMAASILAKVSRDRLMVEYDKRYPGYGFAKHKGYGTKAHQAALAELGPCPIHRRSFAPIRRCLEAMV